MSARYPIPARTVRVEKSIRRSRFLATAGHGPDTDAARAFVDAVKAEFPDATHNCWAFAAGPPGSTAHVGQSDDGEPHGTAGRPMLNALLHADIGEVVVVVTRYFGGVKLGTGGLVRAYSEMVCAALEALPLRQRIETVRLETVLAYEHADAVRRVLPDFEAVIAGERFAADTTLLLELPAENEDALRRAVTDISGGLALIERT